MVQRKTTEIMVLEAKSSEECLQELGMFNLKRRRVKGEMIPVSQYCVWVYSVELQMASTKTNEWKISEGELKSK